MPTEITVPLPLTTNETTTVNLRFDEPIAQRTLYGRPGIALTVKVGAPKPFEEQSRQPGWYCPFRIEGTDGDTWIHYAAGIDSVDALIFALARISEYLATRTDLELSFDGSKTLRLLSAKLLPGITDE